MKPTRLNASLRHARCARHRPSGRAVHYGILVLANSRPILSTLLHRYLEPWDLRSSIALAEARRYFVNLRTLGISPGIMSTAGCISPLGQLKLRRGPEAHRTNNVSCLRSRPLRWCLVPGHYSKPGPTNARTRGRPFLPPTSIVAAAYTEAPVEGHVRCGHIKSMHS